MRFFKVKYEKDSLQDGAFALEYELTKRETHECG